MRQECIANSAAGLVRPRAWRYRENGFSLVEFLVATLILLAASSWIFRVVVDSQNVANYQTQVLAVQDNLRIAMRTLENYLRFAGNDPQGTGFSGITIASATEVRVRSDRTGSAGAGNPDAGEPDGDTNDADEDVTIRYNPDRRAIELISNGGNTQSIADSITDLSLQYLDGSGVATNDGDSVRMIRVSITGGAGGRNLQTGKRYGYQLTADIRLATRQ